MTNNRNHNGGPHLTRLCVRLNATDVEYIREFAARTSREFNPVIRALIETCVRQLRAKDERNLDTVSEPEVDPETVRKILELS